MGKFDNILILSDLDGTFFDEKGTPVPKNIEAVEYFKRSGGHFAFATGRTDKMIYPKIPHPEKIANSPCITANGGCLYDFSEKKSVSERFLDGESGLAVVKEVRKRYDAETVNVRVSTNYGFLTDKAIGYLHSDFAYCPPEAVTELPLERWHEAFDGWYKVTFRASPKVTDELRDFFVPKYGKDFEYSKSDDTIFEFQSKGCDKGGMVWELRRYFEKKVGKIKIFACGDYDNDIPMLEAADVAVCPENAVDEVKKVCDICLCHCNDGLISALVDYIEAHNL